jgi:hypothetical protein
MDATTCGDAMRRSSSCGFASPRNPSSCVVARYAAGPMRGQSVDAITQGGRSSSSTYRSPSLLQARDLCFDLGRATFQ